MASMDLVSILKKQRTLLDLSHSHRKLSEFGGIGVFLFRACSARIKVGSVAAITAVTASVTAIAIAAVTACRRYKDNDSGDDGNYQHRVG